MRTDGSTIRTLDALLEAWAAWIEARPDLSPFTQRAYLRFAARVAPDARSVARESMTRDRYRQIDLRKPMVQDALACARSTGSKAPCSWFGEVDDPKARGAHGEEERR